MARAMPWIDWDLIIFNIACLQLLCGARDDFFSIDRHCTLFMCYSWNDLPLLIPKSTTSAARKRPFEKTELLQGAKENSVSWIG